jgi:hypothetical protein
MLPESATYHPTMVAANTSDNKREAIVAIEVPFDRSRLAHKSASSFTVVAGTCKGASVLTGDHL